MAILAAMARPKFFKGVVLVAPLVMLDKKAASPVTVSINPLFCGPGYKSKISNSADQDQTALIGAV